MSDNSVGPRWLDTARSYIGIREISGPRHHPQIVKWWGLIGSHFRDDETPWCAAFVGGVLEECGIPSTRSAAARSYEKFGLHLDRPAVGAIVTFWRGKPNGWSGHVGFIVGRDQHHNLMVLGGNQGDAVNVKPFAAKGRQGSRVLSYRWPGIAPFPYRYQLPLVTSDGRLSTDEA